MCYFAIDFVPHSGGEDVSSIARQITPASTTSNLFLENGTFIKIVYVICCKEICYFTGSQSHISEQQQRRIGTRENSELTSASNLQHVPDIGEQYSECTYVF